MDIEIGKQVARAMVRDVEGDPRTAALFDVSPAEAGTVIIALKEDLAREARGDYSLVLFPNVRAVLRRQMGVETSRLAAGMGQWAEIIGGVIEAGTAIYTSKLQIKAQKDIFKLQQRAKAAEVAREREAADARAKQAEAAMRAAAGTPLTQAGMPGVMGVPSKLPSWAVPAVVIAGVGLMVIVGIVADKKEARRRPRRRRRR